jgi:hypothetical protein
VRKNWFVTSGGAIGLLSGLPILWGTAIKDGYMHVQMPGWLYLICICAVPISLFVIGLGAKGQAEHSTTDQIQQATEQKNNKG